MKLQTSACKFSKTETLAQVFPCKFNEISKSTFSYRKPPAAASVLHLTIYLKIVFCLHTVDASPFVSTFMIEKNELLRKYYVNLLSLSSTKIYFKCELKSSFC